MILIGERINAGFKDIAEAIRDKTPEPVQRWAQEQARRGADYLDVNIGAVSKDPGDMEWLVTTVRDVVSTKISVDSTNSDITEAGLQALGGRGGLINSTTADLEKLGRLVPLALEYDVSLLGVAMDQRGSPSDADRRVENGAVIFMTAVEGGMDPERVILDPILMPLKFMQQQAGHVLEAIGHYRNLSDPPPHVSVGLSNLASGTTKRGLILRTFIAMAISHGLDAAICDVTDAELLATVATAELVLNEEIYSDSYVRAFQARRGS